MVMIVSVSMIMGMTMIVAMRVPVMMRMPRRGPIIGMGVGMRVRIMARNPEAPTCDPSAECPLKSALGQADGERGKGSGKNLLRYPEVAEGGHGHVAADPGKGVDVEVFHGG
jgi:hypothetical protein